MLGTHSLGEIGLGEIKKSATTVIIASLSAVLAGAGSVAAALTGVSTAPPPQPSFGGGGRHLPFRHTPILPDQKPTKVVVASMSARLTGRGHVGAKVFGQRWLPIEEHNAMMIEAMWWD